MTIETEVNPLRAAMVLNVISQNPGEPIAVENLAKYLPDNFDLGPDDLERYAEAALAEAVTTRDGGSKEPEAVAESAAEIAPEQLSEPPTPEAIEAATLRRIAADQNIANARVAVTVAANAERVARDKLATALGVFQSGFAPITPQELRRQHVQEQQEIRRKIAAGEMPPPRHAGIGKSAVDRAAFYQRGGNPAGGGRAYARGAAPAAAYGRVVAPKVPSVG